MNTVLNPVLNQYRRASDAQYSGQSRLFCREISLPSLTLSRLHFGFGLVGCIAFGTDFLRILAGDGDATEAAQNQASRLWFQLTFMTIYTIALMFVVLQKGALLLVGIAVITLALFPFISLIWSINPPETFRRGVALFGTCAFGVYLGACFNNRELAHLLAVTFALVALLSVFVVFAAPATGIHSDPVWAGAWRGVYLHKNGLGGAAAFGSVVLLMGVISSRGWQRFLFLSGLVCMLLLLANSVSTTGYIVFLVLMGCLLWAGFAQAMPQITILFTSLFLAIICVFLVSFVTGGFVFGWELLGKSSDMSGRIPLWMLSLESVMRAPLLGYGYQAFWSVDTADVNRIAHVLHYRAFYSHNGFIEIMLFGGVALFVIYIVLQTIMICKSIVIVFLDRSTVLSALPFIFSVYFIFANMSESRMLAYNDLVWALFISMLVILRRRISVRS